MENNKVLNAFLDDKKSATGFKKDMLKELNKLTKQMTDEELSSLIYLDHLNFMQDCKSLQRVLDSYAFVFRYKSINEQMKFFLNLHLAEEDRTEINYLRYLIINKHFCTVYNKNTLQINKNHKFKNYLVKNNFSNYFYKHYPNMKDIKFKDILKISSEITGKSKEEELANMIKLGNVIIIKEKLKLKNNRLVIIMLLLNIIEYFTNRIYNMHTYHSFTSDVDLFLSNTFTLVPTDTTGFSELSLIESGDIYDSFYASVLYDITNAIFRNHENTFYYLNPNYSFYKVGINFLLNRSVLLPTNGVILLIKNDEFIESIKLNEYHNNSTHYLEATIMYKTPYRHLENLIIPMSNVTSNIMLFINMIDSSKPCVLDYICDFFDLDISIRFEGSNLPHVDINKYEVISPVYWKYRDNGYISPEEKTRQIKGKKPIRQYKIEVSSYVRKGNATSKQLHLAEELCINLKPGQTITRGYSRVNRKLK